MKQVKLHQWSPGLEMVPFKPFSSPPTLLSMISEPPGAGHPAEELLPLADGDGPGREGRGGEGEPGGLPGRRQPLPEGRTAGQSRPTGHQSAGDQQQQRHRQPHRRRPPAGRILREGERPGPVLLPGKQVELVDQLVPDSFT